MTQNGKRNETGIKGSLSQINKELELEEKLLIKLITPLLHMPLEITHNNMLDHT